MPEMHGDDYTRFNPREECAVLDAHEFGTDLEFVLTDLHVEGAIVSLQLVGPRTIRIQFSTPSGGAPAEVEVSSVERAAWWLCDQGVRH